MRTQREDVRRTLVLGMIAWGLAGCASNTLQAPRNRHFVLDVERTAAPHTRQEGTLCVRMFRVAEPFATDQLVYRVSETLFEIDYHKQFVTPPEAMLTAEVRQWMAAAGLFAHVVDPSSRAEITHTLEGRVVAMYGDYVVADAPHAMLEMQFVLVRETRGRNPVVFDRTYTARTPISGAQADHLIAALNAALREILSDFETDLDGEWERLHAAEP